MADKLGILESVRDTERGLRGTVLQGDGNRVDVQIAVSGGGGLKAELVPPTQESTEREPVADPETGLPLADLDAVGAAPAPRRAARRRTAASGQVADGQPETAGPPAAV